MKPKTTKIIKWSTRSLSLGIILFGLPFYFGYGNPLPFINPDYTLWDNFWLSLFPLMFISLALGWKFPRIGGYLLVIPLTIGLILGLIMEHELIVPMLFPLAAGVLYLITGYQKKA